MAIRIEKEIFVLPIADLEQCCFCLEPTPFWSVKKDVPVCPGCALRKVEEDVPTKRAWARDSNKQEELRN